MSNGFVEVYSKRTGVKQTVPEHWLSHPILGRRFEVVPSQRPAADDTDTVADGEKSIDDMTVAELDQYAADHGIDLTDADRKADKVATIKAATEAASTTSTTETGTPTEGDQGNPQED